MAKLAESMCVSAAFKGVFSEITLQGQNGLENTIVTNNLENINREAISKIVFKGILNDDDVKLASDMKNSLQILRRQTKQL